jgi:hypothetical protein
MKCELGCRKEFTCSCSRCKSSEFTCSRCGTKNNENIEVKVRNMISPYFNSVVEYYDNSSYWYEISRGLGKYAKRKIYVHLSKNDYDKYKLNPDNYPKECNDIPIHYVAK